MKRYYEINEELARLSKRSYSFSDYVEGSATNDYQKQVDYAYELASKVLEENKEKALYLADKYAKKLSENINKRFNIDIYCPSIMITGAGNFPIKKKEKQMARLDTALKEYEYIENYLNKIKDLQYAKVKKEKQGVAKDVDLSNNYFDVVQNEELNRLQLVFDEKPSEEQRALLKKNGFRWSPKNKTWQRQLTDNALYSTERLMILFTELENKE